MVQQLGRRTVANSMRRATATIASFSTKPAQATKVSRHAEQKSYINFQDTLMPGSRVVYLTEGDDETASVTVPFLQSIQDRTKLYSSNSFVEAIGFESKNSKTFCRGIDTMNTSKADQRQCLIQLRELNEMLTSSKGAGRSSPPVSLVALNGEISDAGLTAFWGTTHRLGSLSAKFRVAAMKDHGQLPIGGVASALVDGDQQNIAMARYLALSGAKLNILDLCQLGLVEHVVSDRPLVPIFRQLAQTNHSNDGTKREQPRHVDIGALEDVLTTMAVDEPEILEEIEMHPVWESSLMVPPSEVASNVANEPQQYPVFAGKTWEEVAAFEAAAPDVFSAESPGGLSALFENIEAFVENCFGANHDVRSSKRALEQYIAGLEKQMASSGMGRSALTYATIDKRNAAIAMQRKLYLAKSCMKTMDLTDAAIVQTWFDLTRHAATKDFDGCMRDEITMWK